MRPRTSEEHKQALKMARQKRYREKKKDITKHLFAEEMSKDREVERAIVLALKRHIHQIPNDVVEQIIMSAGENAPNFKERGLEAYVQGQVRAILLAD